jgi:hypothetical protein
MPKKATFSHRHVLAGSKSAHHHFFSAANWAAELPMHGS